MNKQMNICMLAYAHYVNDARIKSYVRTLEDQGHSVDVIALRADEKAKKCTLRAGTIFYIMSKYQGQSTLLYVWSYLQFLLKALFFLTFRSVHHRYDVIHVHNMPNFLVFAAIVPRMFGARVILDVHDLMTVNYMAKFNADENDKRIKTLKIEQRVSAVFADHVFCADHNQQDYLVEHCGVARQKITVLMNLPNVDLFTPIVAEKKDEIFRIVYHGTIAHRLGIDLIVRAVARAAERVPVELWVYGSGDYLPEAVALSSQLGVEGRVHFSGKFFPVEQIPKMVSGMDLGIVGNRHNLACDRYMLPVKLLEYVYLSIPVIVPRLAVISRYFDDTMVRYYEAENVQEMADAIVDLYSNREERERLARAALTFYQKHNPKIQAERYLALLVSPDFGLRVNSERHA
jgi:glycosyltransferase involved in cell wall biosynthesis